MKLIGENKFKIGQKVSIDRFNGTVVDIRTKKKYGLKFIQYKVLIPSIKGYRDWQPQWWFNEGELIEWKSSVKTKLSIWKRFTTWLLRITRL